jgi:hypothetical protein
MGRAIVTSRPDSSSFAPLMVEATVFQETTAASITTLVEVASSRIAAAPGK